MHTPSDATWLWRMDRWGDPADTDSLRVKAKQPGADREGSVDLLTTDNTAGPKSDVILGNVMQDYSNRVQAFWINATERFLRPIANVAFEKAASRWWATCRHVPVSSAEQSITTALKGGKHPARRHRRDQRWQFCVCRPPSRLHSLLFPSRFRRQPRAGPSFGTEDTSDKS